MVPQLTALSADEEHAVHEATLRILGEIGVVMEDEEARTLLLDHGATERSGRVCLPADLVEDCVGRCPRQVTLRGRNDTAITLGDGTLHVHNLGGARDVLDVPGGNLRPAGVQDVAEASRLLDALEHVSSITPLYTPRDVPAPLMGLAMYDSTVRNTIKPINGPGMQNATEARYIAEMMRVTAGDSPAMSLGISPISPLTFPADIAQAIMEVARQGLPFGPLPCPNTGATSPMSLAGSLAQQNAEMLASIVLAQLVRPGLPVVYCGRISVMDMRSGTPVWGNPEVGLISAATVQIGHRYGLPVNVYGLADSCFTIDVQGGYERAINVLVPALAGADELSGVGEMAGGVCSSPTQMVLDNEILGMIKRVRQGFSVDADALAVDVIARVMDGDRNFLAEEHTVRYLRAGEVWRSKVGVYTTSWEMWQRDGRPTALEHAQREAERILRGHEVPPLSDEQTREMDRIMKVAERELVTQ